MGPRAVMDAIEVYMRSLFPGTMTMEQAEQYLQERKMLSEDVWEILEGGVGASPEEGAEVTSRIRFLVEAGHSRIYGSTF